MLITWLVLFETNPIIGEKFKLVYEFTEFRVIVVFWEKFLTDKLKFVILSWKFGLRKTSAAQKLCHRISPYLGNTIGFFESLHQDDHFDTNLIRIWKFDFRCAPPNKTIDGSRRCTRQFKVPSVVMSKIISKQWKTISTDLGCAGHPNAI